MLAVIKLQSLDYPTIKIFKAFTSNNPIQDFRKSFHDINFTVIEPTIHQIVNSHGGLDRFNITEIKTTSITKADLVREVNELILNNRLYPKAWYNYFYW